MPDTRFGSHLAAPLAHPHAVPDAVAFDESHHVRPRLVDHFDEAAREFLGRGVVRAAVDSIAKLFAAEEVTHGSCARTKLCAGAGRGWSTA